MKTINSTAEFKGLFRFNPEKAGLIGVEREAFVTKCGNIVPMAPEVLRNKTDHIGYELSACQVETKTRPCRLDELYSELEDIEKELSLAAQNAPSGPFGIEYLEIAPKNMPLDVYPDPTGRYQRITANMPREILSAACRVAGTHVHIGMPNSEIALEVYNELAIKFARLCEMGNGSFGERLALYRIMAPDFVPPTYAGWNHLYEIARTRGFDTDPSKCWTLIRISVHGTIEFRMFGSTSSIDRIVGWAKFCSDECFAVMDRLGYMV